MTRGGEEIRAPLKTPAGEATGTGGHLGFIRYRGNELEAGE